MGLAIAYVVWSEKQWERNKKVVFWGFLIYFPIKAEMEGATGHGLRGTHRCP